MPSTLEIDEQNGIGTVTHAVSNLNFGSVDAPSLTVGPPTAVVAGQNAFAKYNTLHFTNLNGASSVRNCRVYMDAGSPGNINIRSTAGAAGPYSAPVYAVPSPTALAISTALVSATDPGVATIGIGGSLAGSLTSAGSTDLWVWQAQTLPGIVGMLTPRHFVFVWDEA